MDDGGQPAIVGTVVEPDFAGVFTGDDQPVAHATAHAVQDDAPRDGLRALVMGHEFASILRIVGARIPVLDMWEVPFQVSVRDFEKVGMDLGEAVQAVCRPGPAVADHGEKVAIGRGEAAIMAVFERPNFGVSEPRVGSVAVKFRPVDRERRVATAEVRELGLEPRRVVTDGDCPQEEVVASRSRRGCVRRCLVSIEAIRREREAEGRQRFPRAAPANSGRGERS